MMINNIAILIPPKIYVKWYKTMTWTYLSLLPSSVDHNLWKFSTWFNPQIFIRFTSSMAAMAHGFPGPSKSAWSTSALALQSRCTTSRCPRAAAMRNGEMPKRSCKGRGNLGTEDLEDLGRSKNVEIWGYGEYGDSRINPCFGVNMKDGNLDEQEWDIDSWLMIRKLLQNSIGFMLMTLTC